MFPKAATETKKAKTEEEKEVEEEDEEEAWCRVCSPAGDGGAGRQAAGVRATLLARSPPRKHTHTHTHTHTHISGLKNETTEGRSVGIVGPDPDGRMGGGRTVEGGPGRTVAGR